MPQNPQTRQTVEKLASGVLETATELVAAATDLVPEGAIDAAMETGGNLLEGAVEVGKTVLESAGDILGDAL